MFYPSVASHMFQGVLLFITAIYAFFNFQRIQRFNLYQILILLLLSSIVIGLHGISHALLEKQYNFVPFNLWSLPQK